MKLRTFNRVLSQKNDERNRLAEENKRLGELVQKLETQLRDRTLDVRIERERAANLDRETDRLRYALKHAAPNVTIPVDWNGVEVAACCPHCGKAIQNGKVNMLMGPLHVDARSLKL